MRHFKQLHDVLKKGYPLSRLAVTGGDCTLFILIQTYHEYPPVFMVAVVSQLTVHCLPFVVIKRNRSLLPMSESACFSCWIVRSGRVTSRYSNSRMVGLKSLYPSKEEMTAASTFSSWDKCFQFGISRIFLSKHRANFSIKLGRILKTSAKEEP